MRCPALSASLAPIVLAIGVTAVALPAQAWTATTGGPAARAAMFMVYDSVRERTVLFGGVSGSTALNDTWEHNGTTWSLRSTPVAPPPRNNGAYAYDSRRGRMLIAGGYDPVLGLYPADTWAWNGTTWSQLPQGSLSGRAGASMAYDPLRDCVVLFAGSPGGTARFADTWELDCATNTWQQRFPVSVPTGRSAARMVFDASRGQVLLFGGASTTNALSDTWAWNGTNWTQLGVSAPMTPRYRHGLAYDHGRDRVVLFGGQDQNGSLLGDLWTLSGNSWTPLAVTGPAPRLFMGFVYDDARDGCLLFGGGNGASQFSDCYNLASSVRATYTQVGTGCTGNAVAPKLRRELTQATPATCSVPRLATTFRAEVVDVPATAGAVFCAFGFTGTTWSGLPLPVDLGMFGMPNCMLRIDAQSTSFLAPSAAGYGWSLTIPLLPALLSAPFDNQALVFDASINNPMGAVVSNAMHGVVGI